MLGVPLIWGAAVGVGDVVTVDPAVTGLVAAELALAEPAELLAVTVTRIVDPALDDGTTNELPVAFENGTQESPLEVHDFHW